MDLLIQHKLKTQIWSIEDGEQEKLIELTPAYIS